MNRTPPSATPSGAEVRAPSRAHEGKLPLKTHSVDGKCQAKVLSEDDIQGLKAEVTDTLLASKQSKRKGNSGDPISTGGTSADQIRTNKGGLPRGAAARTAARMILDSLATPAPPAEKPKKGKAKSAAKSKTKPGTSSSSKKTPKSKA